MKHNSVFSPPISERLIISLYDYTGAWAKPFIDAGYPVMLWDKKVEGDILEHRSAEKWLMGYEGFVYGILAAPPCTDFAGSGARWWSEKDKDVKRIETAIDLVQIVLFIVSICENLKFWSLENPVGRIEKLIPELKPYRNLTFHPCDFGDAYTKRTILWGEFNNNLKKNPVEPVMYELNGKRGSIFWKLPPSEKRAELRSATPVGFAKAFFEAQHLNEAKA